MLVQIDGDTYVKETEQNISTIGIGITTHNRNQLVASTVAKMIELTPNAKVVVVDDCSEYPVRIDGVEVYRFSTNVGIAKAKNKCLELLADCENIFLFDDDTYPEKPLWYAPYVASKEHHLMYLFEDWASGVPVGDDSIVYEDGDIVAHAHARGCMLYVDQEVLRTVGGMDVRYGKAMNEHLDYSDRIYNAGLTTFPYMDVPNSNELIHSMDEYQETKSTISKIERGSLVVMNNALLRQNAGSSAYMPYGRNAVVASYFTGVFDAQRVGTDQERWQTNTDAIHKLKHSVEYYGLQLDLIHNCFDDMPNLTTISRSPYFERWLKEWQYLRDHPEIEYCFVVDSTDVDMLRYPFNDMQAGVLYVGDEPEQTLANEWLLTRHLEPTVNNFFRQHQELPLLNCGVVGGTRQLVMDVCRDIYEYGFAHPEEQTEMGVFNWLMHTKYADKLEYGRHVTTIFKQYEARSKAWFRHK